MELYIAFMVASLDSYDDDLNKQDFFFVLRVANNFYLEGHKSYTNLSNFKWLCNIIHILQVLKYKVISRSKFFFQYFWFLYTELHLGRGFKPDIQLSWVGFQFHCRLCDYMIIRFVLERDRE